MKQQKRHRTNFISGVIALVTLGLLVLLAVALYKHTELEVRFDALISWLRRLDESIVGLDSDFEIILCIFALYVAKCQLPIPMGVLCVISGVVFPLGQAMLINMVFLAFFFAVKYAEGSWIGGGWVVFKAPELSYEAIIKAYDDMRFYSSTGPEIKQCYIEDGVFVLDCSPVRRVHLMTQGIDPVYCGYSPENDLTHIEIDISKVPDTARFLWLQLTDGVGHKAWMNPYYLKD